MIIKPVMDACTTYSASVIGFLSGVTVLCMSAYSILRACVSGNSKVQLSLVTKLGTGAAIGGIIGKLIFDIIKKAAGDSGAMTAVQSVLLFLMTIGTLLYSLSRRKIKTKRIRKTMVVILTGLGLGMISSFLGIGGGPINLVVLYYLFSMETKEAAQNSLYIILLSQIASTFFTIVRGTVPKDLPMMLLFLMAAAGIAGGIVGRLINSKISSRIVEKLFLILLGIISIICIYNFMRSII